MTRTSGLICVGALLFLVERGVPQDVSTQGESKKQPTVNSPAPLTGHAGWVSCLAFSSDGKLLASGSNDKTIRIWDAATGKLRSVLEGPIGEVACLAFNPASGLLASGGGTHGWTHPVTLWDPITGRVRRTLNGHQGPVRSLAFTPDGKQLASADSSGVKLWDMTTGRLVATFAGSSSEGSLAFSKDGAVLASSADKTLTLWDVNTGLQKAVFKERDGAVRCLAFSPDGALLAAVADLTVPAEGTNGLVRSTSSSIKLWNVKTLREDSTLKTEIYLGALAFSPDGALLASAGANCKVTLWDVKTRKEKLTLESPQGTLNAMEFSPNSSLLAAGGVDQTVTLWANPMNKQSVAVNPAAANKEPPSVKTASTPTRSTTEERKKAFQWFNGLGFPDAKDRKLIRVVTGTVCFNNGKPATNTFVDGFLLDEKGDRFTVLTLSLAEESYEKTPNGEAPVSRVGFEYVDWKAGATAYLKALQAPKDDSMNFPSPWEEDLGPRTKAFVWAWACWRNGLDELAGSLYDQALKLPKGYGLDPESPPAQPLQALVAEDLASIELRRAAIVFYVFNGRPVARTELVKRFEHIVKHYPGTEHYEDAKRTVDLLTQMIAEDAEHAKKHVPPLDKLSIKDRVAELIFQLRDQNQRPWPATENSGNTVTITVAGDGAAQISGSAGNFAPWQGSGETAAHKLAKIGFEAVPQLIDHIDDQRFTRLARSATGFHFPDHIIRVGDCAVKILEHVAARRFWKENERTVQTKRRIQEWHDGYLKKGEKQMLIEGVTSGDENSYDQAVRLTERYPDAALAAIRAGLEAVKDPAVRVQLIAAAGAIAGDSPVPLLLTELKEGPSAAGRLSAAMSLHRRSRPEAVRAMIAEWHGKRPQPKARPVANNVESENPDDALPIVAKFLAESCNVEAIAALEKNLGNRSLTLRQEVHSCCWRALAPNNENAPKLPKAVRLALEHVLISMLDDTDLDYGLTCNRKGKPISAPRVCDTVAETFNRMTPKTYPFDLAASLYKRDCAIIEIKNAWLAPQGIASFPVPAPKKIAAIPEEEVLAWTDRILATPRPGNYSKAQYLLAGAWHRTALHLEKIVKIDDRPFLETVARRLAYGDLLGQLLSARAANRRDNLRQAEKLGLGALPGLAKLQQQNSDPEERAVLEKLARRLAFIVAETGFSQKSIKPDQNLARELAALNGKPFDADSLMKLVRVSMQTRAKTTRGMSLAVDRAGDGTGVTIKVDLLDEPRVKQIPMQNGITLDFGNLFGLIPGSRKSTSNWKTWHAVDAGAELSENASDNGGDVRGFIDLQDWQSSDELPSDLQEALRQACATPANEPIRIRLLLVADFSK
jgi:WD40 repeat protein